MAWVVDTCIMIDVLENDSSFGYSSAKLLESLESQGLVISPVSYVELAPAFLGDTHRQNEFLDGMGIERDEVWLHQDTKTAHRVWNSHIEQRRSGRVIKRPVADVLIGAFASRYQGLITRNEKDFLKLFPSLTIMSRLEG